MLTPPVVPPLTLTDPVGAQVCIRVDPITAVCIEAAK